MHELGIVAALVGGGTALTAEGVLLWGSFSGRWEMSDFQRRPAFKRWFFSGLALAVAGSILAVTR